MSEDIYQQIQHEIRQVADAFGISESVSGDFSTAITNRLQRLLGKNTVYFPCLGNTEQRYAAIKADFNGRNHTEVCKKHGISRSTLYRAVNDEKMVK